MGGGPWEFVEFPMDPVGPRKSSPQRPDGLHGHFEAAGGPRGGPWEFVEFPMGPERAPPGGRMACMGTSRRPVGHEGVLGISLNFQWVPKEPPAAGGRPAWALRGGRWATRGCLGIRWISNGSRRSPPRRADGLLGHFEAAMQA